VSRVEISRPDRENTDPTYAGKYRELVRCNVESAPVGFILIFELAKAISRTMVMSMQVRIVIMMGENQMVTFNRALRSIPAA
jgi:hypothetical protein